MHILVTGANGQLGHELGILLPQSLGKAARVTVLDRSQLDLADLGVLGDKVRALQPDLVVNAAAYTAVDQAESEQELALRINAGAPALLAQEAARLGIPLIHYSTDYVFDGSGERPWVETDPVAPLNAYGASKLEGEKAIAASGAAALVLRTQWVYGLRGKNFLLTMLRLAAERDELRVVNDQFGAPTWSRTLARATAAIISQAQGRDWWQQKAGIYHVAAQGSTSWCGFAERIVQLAALPKPPRVVGIPSSAYPTPARRPMNGRLDCSKFIRAFGPLPMWDDALAECMQERAAS